jgi:hypothetical protein
VICDATVSSITTEPNAVEVSAGIRPVTQGAAGAGVEEGAAGPD